jgi:hypothetical protein
VIFHTNCLVIAILESAAVPVYHDKLCLFYFLILAIRVQEHF